MAARHVRERRTERDAHAQGPLIGLRGARDAAPAIEQARNRPSLLHDRNEGPLDVRRVRIVGILFTALAEPRFDQHPIRWRHGVRHRLEIADRIVDAVRRLLRDDRRRHPALAAPVLVVEEVELTLRGRLPGQAQVHAVLPGGVDRFVRRVGRVRPFRDVAGVEVPEQAADVILLIREAGRGVEPEAVLLQRPAETRIDIRLQLQAVRRRQPPGHQVRVAIAPLKRGVGAGGKQGPRVLVASRLRDHVDLEPAGDALGGDRRVVNRHFLRAAHVRQHVGGPPGAFRVRDRHAVDQQTRVGDAAAVHRQRPAGRVDDVGAADIDVAQVDAGNQERRDLRRASGRNRHEQFLIDDALLGGALDIDDGRFAGDGEGFRKRTDLQVGVDRRRERSGQLDAIALQRRETGEGKRDGVDAAAQLLDPVLTRAVGDGRARLLDQGRARGFNRDTRQDGAGGVAHDTGDGRRALRRGADRGAEDQDEPDQDT